MTATRFAGWMLTQEARALLTRLERVKPFALHETMVPAANVSPSAQSAIEHNLAEGRQMVHRMVRSFLVWLQSPYGRRATPDEAQRRFSLLRLRFNVMLSQFDIFSDALTQRSENETGVWLSGLDVAAADALALPEYYQSPPVVCYLDRGMGAAIRRARTRLPGGGQNPVAIIRVPRERMVGSGIASSLVHEVGHQASALLGLIESLRPLLRGMQGSGSDSFVWRLWERWISEILADFWSVARVGVAATMGLMGVVSLPRAFVFRVNLDDPHPFPWIRVKLSCAMGHALYPHPQWANLSDIWGLYYPTERLDAEKRQLLTLLEAGMPAFVTLLANHRPRMLRGTSLKEVLEVETRQPSRLAEYYMTWRNSPRLMREASPVLAFAVIGQARADGVITPEKEGNTIMKLLQYWALRSTLNMPEVCAQFSRVSVGAPIT